MTKVADYGRYADDPEHVGCPRARTSETPCVARDGATAMLDEGRCVGCLHQPTTLLTEFRHESRGYTGAPVTNQRHAADKLKAEVRAATEPRDESMSDQPTQNESTPSGLPMLATGVYQHFKGDQYQVLGYANDANADTLFVLGDKDRPIGERYVVVYVPLYPHSKSARPRMTVRDVDEFFGTVETDLGRVPRFRFVHP